MRKKIKTKNVPRIITKIRMVPRKMKVLKVEYDLVNVKVSALRKVPVEEYVEVNSKGCACTQPACLCTPAIDWKLNTETVVVKQTKYIDEKYETIETIKVPRIVVKVVEIMEP